jgi:hypothetical protein
MPGPSTFLFLHFWDGGEIKSNPRAQAEACATWADLKFGHYIFGTRITGHPLARHSSLATSSNGI